MPFIPVFSAASLSVDYDSHQDCLFLTLHGQLELRALQDITLEGQATSAAKIYPARCLVLDNMSLTGPDTFSWLVDRLLPSFHHAGVQHWTWVCNPTLRSHQLAEQVARRLPQLMLTVFSDLEHAATWLKRAS
jgi:hypothetical protein